MRIELIVEGGFAPLGGPSRRFCVDQAALDPAQLEELGALLRAAHLGPGGGPELSGMPDVFVYRLRVTDEQGDRTMTFDDLTATPDLRALVARVRDLATPPPASDPAEADH